MNQKIYDVSTEITEDMQVYKNKDSKRPRFENIDNYEIGNHYASYLHIDCHAGTHVDAPLHMIENAKDLSYLKLENLIREVKVYEINSDLICKEDLINIDIQEGDFILFKTRNSEVNEFKLDYCALHSSGAEYLADKKICGVGVDALSVGRGDDNLLTHKTLMEEEIIIIEGLRLKDVQEGTYNMIALPLKINTLEGCPMRVILRK
ncbi:MAG: cyclase family protein [Lachnospirales bacterium]